MTASARLIDALLNTAGIIAGVGAGLTAGNLLGVGLVSLKPGAAGLAEVGVTVLGPPSPQRGSRSPPGRRGAR